MIYVINFKLCFINFVYFSGDTQYTLSFTENILPTESIYMVVISAKYSFTAFFFTTTKLGYEMYLDRLRS